MRLGRTRMRTDKEYAVQQTQDVAGACHKIQPWYDGWDAADALAKREGEAALADPQRLHAAVERQRPVKFEDHPALFGEEEAPKVTKFRLNDAQRLRRWQGGLHDAPTLPDAEQ